MSNHDLYKVHLPSGNRAVLHIPSPLSRTDRAMIVEIIDLVLSPNEREERDKSDTSATHELTA